MSTFNFDIIILGAGPAGLSSAIYGARGGSSVAVLDTSMAGGKLNFYQDIENYPGVTGISSFQLAEKMKDQAKKFKVEIFECQVIKEVSLRKKEVVTEINNFKGKVIIIATGSKPKLLGVKGEKEFFGKGVSYCAVCDGPFCKDKEVAVIGGGNSAIEEALYLTKFAEKVYILHRRDKLRAFLELQERAFTNPKIEILWNCEILEIEGDRKVTSIHLKKDGKPMRLEVSNVFPFIGSTANTEIFTKETETGYWYHEGEYKEGIDIPALHLGEGGFVVTQPNMLTTVDGVYAVGDVREKSIRQVVTATSDGAIAGILANRYLDIIGRIVK